MQGHLIWVYVHVVLFALWIGPEIGVFVAVSMARNAKRSFEARLALVRLALILDRFPRVSFALMLPASLHLMQALGLSPLSDNLIGIGWAFALFWLASTVLSARNEGQRLAQFVGHLAMISQLIVGLIFVVIGLNSLATGAPLEETWFAVKFLLYGLVFWCTIAIDLCFGPFMTPFMEIGPQGSSPEREEAVSRAVGNTRIAMVTLFALMAVIVFLGTVKP